MGFDCSCCGDCCSGKMDIFINRKDLIKIKNHLKLSSIKDLFSKGLIELKPGQNDTLLPKIKFKKYPYPHCPFLMNSVEDDMSLKGYCSLHPHSKPLVCKLAPITRVYNTESKLSSYSIAIPTESCPGELTSVSEYIHNSVEDLRDELKKEEEFYRELSKNTLQSYE